MIRRLLPNLLFLCGLVLLFSSCSPKDNVPKDVLSVDKMSDILLDFELADAYNPSYYRQSEKDSIYPEDHEQRLQVFYQQILEMHDIDTATFFHSFRYYTHHPDWIKKVYQRMEDSVQVKLAVIQTRIQDERENSRNHLSYFMSFWRKDLDTRHAFRDSIVRESSRLIFPWETLRMTERPTTQKRIQIKKRDRSK